MSSLQEKKYGVYHWDTFDNETILLAQFDKLAEASNFVQTRYKGRISSHGADKVDVVDFEGNIVISHWVC